MANFSKTEYSAKQIWTIAAIVFGVVIFALAGWLWWTRVYQSPKNVFWGMLNNNLQTHGVQKTIDQTNGGTTTNQIAQLSLGADTGVRIKTTLTQQVNGRGKSKIITDTVANKDAMYQRYRTIELSSASGQKADFGPVLNVWGKTELGATSNSNPVLENMYGIVPMALLGQPARKDIIKEAKDGKAFVPDYASVKTSIENGRKVYIYQVTINPAAYINILKEVDKQSGVKQLTNLSPNDYKGAQTLKVVVTIDVYSRQLKKVDYGESGRVEQYASFGLHPELVLPKESIASDLLQQRIQQILAPSP